VIRSTGAGLSITVPDALFRGAGLSIAVPVNLLRSPGLSITARFPNHLLLGKLPRPLSRGGAIFFVTASGGMCTQVHLKPFPLYFQSQEEAMGTSLLPQPTPQIIAPQEPLEQRSELVPHAGR
jgi:hypothetical protein